MSRNSNIPDFRFPGFFDDWVKVKFKDFTFNSGKKNKQNLPLDRYSISNEKGFIPQVDQFDGGAGYLKDIDCSMYIIVSPKSFAYNPARINVGSIGYQDLEKDVIVSSLYEVFQTTDICDDSFLWHWFHSDVFHRMVLDIQEGGVRQYFYYDKLKECSIFLPSIAEQKKIAECLSSMDDTISAQQKKVDALKEHKKGMMQQMFPAFGETTPSLRFPGFEGEWSCIKFKDFTFNSGKKNKQNLPLERYSISNEKGFVPQMDQFDGGAGYLKDIDCSMYIVVSPASFAYNPARINVGSIGYQNLGKDVIVSSLYEVFQTSDVCDDSFLWHWFHSDIFHRMVLDIQEGGVRQYFYYDKLKECTIRLPSLQEQQKIAECLSTMDETIASEEKKLEALNDHKRGMMQKMFPNPTK